MITWDFVPMHHLFEELRPVLARHYQEIAEDDEPFNFNWDLYEMASKSNRAWAVTARHDGKLVGYILFTLSHSLRHSHVLEATSSGWYVEPEHRGKLGSMIVNKADEYLKAIGVRRTRFILGGAAGKLLERKGYKTNNQVWEIKYE